MFKSIRGTVVGLILAIGAVAPANAEIVYDNITTATGAIEFGGAVAVGNGHIASLDLDDITVANGFGGAPLTGFIFVGFNANGVALNAQRQAGHTGQSGGLLDAKEWADLTAISLW